MVEKQLMPSTEIYNPVCKMCEIFQYWMGNKTKGKLMEPIQINLKSIGSIGQTKELGYYCVAQEFSRTNNLINDRRDKLPCIEVVKLNMLAKILS